MSLGLALSCIINLAICFSPKLNGVFNLLDGEGKATMGLVYLIGSLWVLNGYVHGMGWNAVFVVAIVFGLLGTLILSSFWRAPADGYAKAEEILKQCR